MAFAIQSTGPTGPATTQLDTPVEALTYAVEMLEKGYADVVIVDLSEDGKAYAPAEFRDLYLEGRG
jgi:3-oxoacyl-(acyl-carrier-protein) synthase